jgi:hypothetical protein
MVEHGGDKSITKRIAIILAWEELDQIGIIAVEKENSKLSFLIKANARLKLVDKLSELYM